MGEKKAIALCGRAWLDGRNDEEKHEELCKPLGLYSGLGMANVWGFPNKLGSNGGGAFLLIYLLFIFIFSYVGLPA